MALLSFSIGLAACFLSGYSFGKWMTGDGRSWLIISAIELLTGGYFILSVIGSAINSTS